MSCHKYARVSKRVNHEKLQLYSRGTKFSATAILTLLLKKLTDRLFSQIAKSNQTLKSFCFIELLVKVLIVHFYIVF